MNTRENTRRIIAGGVPIGGGAAVSVQSMCNVRTSDVDAAVAQIRQLRAAGCDIVRLAVPDMAAARAISAIKEQVDVPLVADIHFDYRLALEAAARGIDKIRINPGNIGGRERVAAVARECSLRNIPIRIGVNGGSLEKPLLEKYGHPTAEAIVESAKGHIRLLNDCGFDDIRVSLTADPVEEVKAGIAILKAAGLRKGGVRFVSCPTCGRTEIDLIGLAHEVEERLQGLQADITVAVMGCVVNGPGEAREADYGIAGGKGCGLLFKKGEIVRRVPEDELLGALMELIESEVGA